MRRRSLSARRKKPLILTALDRKMAGLPPEGIAEKKPKKRKTFAIQPDLNYFTEKPAEPKEKKTRRPKKIKSYFSAQTFDTFEPPLIEPPTPAKRTRAAKIKPSKRIAGEITHYYEKIKVAVISVCDTICVGDYIAFEMEDGIYEQVVESMEINREPVFKAETGDDIGIKVRRAAKIGGKVFIM